MAGANKRQIAEIIAIALVSTGVTIVLAHLGVINLVNQKVVRKVVK